MLDITPRNTTTGVIRDLGVAFTVCFSRAVIRPDCSATPTPSMATSTMPRGA